MKQADRSAATIGKILESATTRFAAKGMETVTLEEISHSAGLSKGAVYTHFRSKREVVEAVMRQVIRDNPPQSENLRRLFRDDKTRLLAFYWLTYDQEPVQQTLAEAG